MSSASSDEVVRRASVCLLVTNYDLAYNIIEKEFLLCFLVTIDNRHFSD
jgi:hypothetical protein